MDSCLHFISDIYIKKVWQCPPTSQETWKFVWGLEQLIPTLFPFLLFTLFISDFVLHRIHDDDYKTIEFGRDTSYVFHLFKMLTISLRSNEIELQMIRSKVCWFSVINGIFHWCCITWKLSFIFSEFRKSFFAPLE